MKKVSVIVPCHNSSEYIDKCLNHIENQTIGIENLEIILVDDASDDCGATLEKLKEFEKNHSDNTIVISLSENVKQGGARNVGIQYATGEYLIFCDSDDWLLYGAISRLYEIAKKYDADEVEFDICRVASREDGEYENECEERCKSEPQNISIYNIDTVDERKINIFRSDSTYGHCDKIYRTKLIQENDIRFPEGVSMEEPPFTILVRFYERKYLRLHSHLYFAHVRENSTTQSDYNDKKFDNAIAHLMLWDELNRRGFRAEYLEEIEYIFWYWYFLNTVLFAIYRKTFFDEDEYRMLLKNIIYEVTEIEANTYFQKNWGLVPQLAKVMYMDPSLIGMNTLRELFTKLNDLCN